MGLLDYAIEISPPIFRKYGERIRSSSVGHRLARGAFWAVVGTVVARLFGMVAGILTARILGKEGYGEFGVIQNTIGLVGLFAGLGMGTTAVKHVAELRLSDPARAGRVLGFSVSLAATASAAMAVVLLLTAPWLAAHALAQPRLTGLLRLSAMLMVLSTLNGVQIAALSGFEAFRRISTVNLVTGLLTLPLVIGGTLLLGIKGTVLGYTATVASSCLLAGLALRREYTRTGIRPSYSMKSTEWRLFWRFSFPATMAGMMVAPVNWACMAMLVNRPGGYGEMGIFNAANQWFMAAMMLPSTIGQAILPVLSERIGAGDNRRSASILKKCIQLNAVVVLIPSLLGGLLSTQIMKSYGAGFTGGWRVLLVCLLTACLVAVQTPVGLVLVASGRLWTGFLMNAGWGAVFVGSTVLLLPMGAFGLASARCLAYLVHTTWVAAYVLYLLRGRESRGDS